MTILSKILESNMNKNSRTIVEEMRKSAFKYVKDLIKMKTYNEYLHEIAKLTEWGFYKGDRMFIIDEETAEVALKQLLDELKHAPEYFLWELQENIFKDIEYPEEAYFKYESLTRSVRVSQEYSERQYNNLKNKGGKMTKLGKILEGRTKELDELNSIFKELRIINDKYTINFVSINKAGDEIIYEIHGDKYKLSIYNHRGKVFWTSNNTPKGRDFEEESERLTKFASKHKGKSFGDSELPSYYTGKF